MVGTLLGVHHAVQVDEQGFARRHVAHEAVAGAFQGHGLAGQHHLATIGQLGLAVAQRADAVGIAEGDHAVAGDQADHGIRALDAFHDGTHRLENGRRGQGQLATGQLQLVREHVEQHLGVAVGVEVTAVDGEQVFAQGVGVGQVAVVHQHQAEGRVHVEGLGLFLIEGVASGRVADLTQAHGAGQRTHVAGAEHVLHHAAGLVHEELATVRIRSGRHDPRRILTAVLQQQQRVIDQLVDGRLGNHTNDAAHGSPLPKKQKLKSYQDCAGRNSITCSGKTGRSP
jgi:hypothetical protein